MHRPLLRVVIAYGLGIAIGQGLEPAWPALLALTAAVTLLSLLRWKLGPGLLALGLVLAGWSDLVLHRAALSPHDLRVLLGPEPREVTLRGRLRATPTEIAGRSPAFAPRSLAELRTQAVGGDHQWQPAEGIVLVRTRGLPGPEYFQGREVVVRGVLRPPQGPSAEGLFDYAAYLAQRGVYFELEVASPSDWALAHAADAAPTPPLADRFRRWAQATLAQGLPEEDEPLHLLWGMVLGWRPALTGEIVEPFRLSGTMHLFAISGLHIALIAGILVSLCRVFRVPRGACWWVVIPLLWFYTAATGWQPSAIRATIMMTLVILGWSLRRPTDLVNSLAGAALLILVWDPQQLFQAGFQLSFSAVLGIALVMPKAVELAERWCGHDPWQPADLQPRWQRRWRGALRALLLGLATSLAAWCGTLPWVARYFHLVTPVSLVANLVAVPLSSLALACSLGSLCVGDAWAWASGLFNHSAWLWMVVLLRSSEIAAALPGAWFHVGARWWMALGVYSALFLGLTSGWLLRPSRRLVLILAVGLAAWLSWRPDGREVTLTVLPLRGGDSLLFNGPGAAGDMLVDTGDAAAVGFVTSPFLAAQGVNWLPTLVLTHGDIRHVGGALAIFESFRPRQIITGTSRFRSPVYRQFLDQLATVPGRWRRVAAGDQVGGWAVLHPGADDRFARADDGALVLRGEFNGLRILLCSDLGRQGQRRLFERCGSELRADLVVAGMPNVDEPLGDALLDAIEPALVVISAGDQPASERPSLALRGRLAARGVPVLFTIDTGAVTAHCDGGVWTVETIDGRRYVAQREAGRIVFHVR